MSVTAEKNTSWLTAFEAFDRRSTGSDWLRRLRQQAFARFWELGFPTTHDEDWRFTNVAPIARTEFQPAGYPTSVTAEALPPYRLPGMAGQLVFVNGRYTPELSETGSFPSDLTAGSLAIGLEKNGAQLEQHLARYEDYRNDAFTALNTAFLEDGACILIPRGAVLEQPVHILYVTTAGAKPRVVHPRNLILVGEQAQVTVIEDYVSLGESATPSFANVVSELIAGDGSVVEHYMIEREDPKAYNVSSLHIRQGRASNVASHSVLLGGALVRNNVHPVLAGEGAECLLNGLFVGSGTQHLDNYMKVEHQAPHSGSRQFYNGILESHAHGVFHGRIIVHPGAQKTDAKQTNRNLLLSDDAQIDTKPQLEIYADDVKCTHGATIGQIDEGALFYLRSRGLPETEARALLLYAFANESLDRMRAVTVREWLSRTLTEWLPGSGDRKERG